MYVYIYECGGYPRLYSRGAVRLSSLHPRGVLNKKNVKDTYICAEVGKSFIDTVPYTANGDVGLSAEYAAYHTKNLLFYMNS